MDAKTRDALVELVRVTELEGKAHAFDVLVHRIRTFAYGQPAVPWAEGVPAGRKSEPIEPVYPSCQECGQMVTMQQNECPHCGAWLPWARRPEPSEQPPAASAEPEEQPQAPEPAPAPEPEPEPAKPKRRPRRTSRSRKKPEPKTDTKKAEESTVQASTVQQVEVPPVVESGLGTIEPDPNGSLASLFDDAPATTDAATTDAATDAKEGAQ